MQENAKLDLEIKNAKLHFHTFTFTLSLFHCHTFTLSQEPGDNARECEARPGEHHCQTSAHCNSQSALVIIIIEMIIIVMIMMVIMIMMIMNTFRMMSQLTRR